MNIEEAAGALLNAGLNHEISHFYNNLADGHARKIEEKLKLLLNAEHKGVELMTVGWKMSKKRMNKLARQYPYEFQRYKYMF